MPAKYSHVKKRSASGLLKKEKNSPNGHHIVKAPASTPTSHSNNPNSNSNSNPNPNSYANSSSNFTSNPYSPPNGSSYGSSTPTASHHHHHHHQTHSHPAAYSSYTPGSGNGGYSASGGYANAKGSGKTNSGANGKANGAYNNQRSLVPSLPPHLTPHAELRLTEALSAVSQLERAISRLLLLRYDQDIARLFSTHLHRIALVHLPAFVIRVASVAGPGWLAWNIGGDGYGNGSTGGYTNTNGTGVVKYGGGGGGGGTDPGEAVRDWLRTLIGMDLREVGERVATKSVLWSYTALREFAISNNIPICSKTGLHSLRLLPHYHALKSHLDELEKGAKAAAPGFVKPPHLSSLDETHKALEEACAWAGGMFGGMGGTGGGKEKEGKEKESKGKGKSKGGTGKERDKDKDKDKDKPSDPTPTTLALRASYTALTSLLWSIAQEFDVRGYGRVLREKLEERWCECGCSTEHLGAVCEGAVREGEVEWDEEEDSDSEGSTENDDEGEGGEGEGGGKGGKKKNKKAEARARRERAKRKYEAEVDDNCDCEKERMEWTRRMKNGQFGDGFWGVPVSMSGTGGSGGGGGVMGLGAMSSVLGDVKGKASTVTHAGGGISASSSNGLPSNASAGGGRNRTGKQREWDGRGSGVFGWETREEEDVWEIGLDFAAGGTEMGEGVANSNTSTPTTSTTATYTTTTTTTTGMGKKGKDKKGDKEREREREREREAERQREREREKQREKEAEEERVEREVDKEMTVSELMEWRYLRAEREKEEGNKAFRKGDYESAIRSYENAYTIEGEVPHYQLNLAAAHLKLNNWIQAEEACTRALSQHRSTKGLYRRAKARKMLGRKKDAVEDLRAVLRLQPHNDEAIVELASLLNVDLSNLANLSPPGTPSAAPRGKVKGKKGMGGGVNGSGSAGGSSLGIGGSSSGAGGSSSKKKSKKTNANANTRDEYSSYAYDDGYFASGSGSSSGHYDYHHAGGSSSSAASGSGSGSGSSSSSGSGSSSSASGSSSSSGSSSFGFGSSSSASSSSSFTSSPSASSSSSSTAYQNIRPATPIAEEEETYDSESARIHAALLRLLGVDPSTLIYTTLTSNNRAKNAAHLQPPTAPDSTFSLERTKADSKRLRLGFYGASSTSNTLSSGGGPGSGASGVLNGGLVINGVSVNLSGLGGLEGVISSLGGAGGANAKLEEVFGSIQRQFEKHQERMGKKVGSGAGKGKGKGGKSGNGGASGNGGRAKPADSPARDKRLLEMEKLRKECGVYPGWDRYFVKEG